MRIKNQWDQSGDVDTALVIALVCVCVCVCKKGGGGVTYMKQFMSCTSQGSTYGRYDRHRGVKIGGGQVKIHIGSPTGRVCM